MRKMKQLKLLLVANEAKEHILKFHQPTIKMMINEGWVVDVACGGDEKIECCNTQYKLPISRSPLHTKWNKGYRMLKKIIDENHYDIVYCHTSVGALLAQIACKDARQKGTKLIKFAHGTYFYKNAPLLNWLYYPLYKYLSFITDVMITITQEDYQFTSKHFSHAKTYLVDGIGIDTSRFTKEISDNSREIYRRDMNIPQDATVLIYCAELIKNKNQKLLLDSLKEVMKTRPNVYLVLVGIDHIDGKYKEYSKRLSVEDHVRFLGWRNDIAQLYDMADICVASSIREGFGLNIVEAMLCKRPVIATNNSGHASIINDGYNGFLVKLGASNIFADRIIRLTDDVKLRGQFVDNAYKDINKYSSFEILKKLKEIFYKTIK